MDRYIEEIAGETLDLIIKGEKRSHKLSPSEVAEYGKDLDALKA